MAIQRDRPYKNSNFLVQIGQGDATSVLAGFVEVSGLAIDVGVPPEYRNGNSRVNHAEVDAGLYGVSPVTLRRGLIGALDLYQWIDAVRTGNEDVRQPVRIELQDESHNGPVFTWNLVNAFPIRYVGPILVANGNDVAIEELVLAYEDLSCE
jgi:phage tail-like protein